MQTDDRVWLPNDDESASTWLRQIAFLPYMQPIRNRAFEFCDEALV